MHLKTEWVVEYRGRVSGQWFERGRHGSPTAAAAEADRERAARGPLTEVRLRPEVVPAAGVAARVA